MPRSTKSKGGARPKTRYIYSTDETSNNKPRKNEAAESKFCSDINGSIQAYESVLVNFCKMYLVWQRERRINLSKLEKLAAEIHEDQLSFNKTSLFFKEANMASRELKSTNNPNMDFFASLAIFLTDAVDGVNSIAQACNVDKYMKTFGEIMEGDAEITKPLHEIRSRCFARYHDVEEIIRRYHTDTFGTTIDKISRSLRTEDLWLDLKRTNNTNNITQIIEVVDEFFQLVSRVEVFNDVCRSVGSYVDSNPAVLEACESTGKALYGIYDTWGRNRDPKGKNTVSSNRVSSVVNRTIMFRERREIRRLQSLTLEEDSSQAKLESKIREAIDDLEEEAREMKNLYDNSNSFVASNARCCSSNYSGYNDYL